MIVATVKAHCDLEGCVNSQALSSDNLQPYTTLTHAGWHVDVAAGEIFMLCPEHNPANT